MSSKRTRFGNPNNTARFCSLSGRWSLSLYLLLSTKIKKFSPPSGELPNAKAPSFWCMAKCRIISHQPQVDEQDRNPRPINKTLADILDETEDQMIKRLSRSYPTLPITHQNHGPGTVPTSQHHCCLGEKYTRLMDLLEMAQSYRYGKTEVRASVAFRSTSSLLFIIIAYEVPIKTPIRLSMFVDDDFGIVSCHSA